MDLMKMLRSWMGGKEATARPYADVGSGLAPVYSQSTPDVYSSEIVLQSVQCVANEIKKLKPRHVVETSDSLEVQAGDIAGILAKPNEFMTLADFLENITYRLFQTYNVFIYPTWVQVGNQRKYTGLYPLKPVQVDFLQDAAGTLFVRMLFGNGKKYELPYSDVIHWRYRYSSADFMGGGPDGRPDERALLETLKLNRSARNAVMRAANAPVNGVVRYGSVISEDKLREKVAEFNADLKKNESGILQLDAKSEFQQLASGSNFVDAATMDFIKQEIADHYGVSLPMLHSTATVAEKQAFYDKTIEPLVESLNQAFTDCLISKGRRERNHRIVFYEKDLIFMTMEQKLEFVKQLGERGALTNNQILGIFGMPPYEGGDVRLQSLNYVDSKIANKYQEGKSGTSGTPPKQEGDPEPQDGPQEQGQTQEGGTDGEGQDQ